MYCVSCECYRSCKTNYIDRIDNAIKSEIFINTSDNLTCCFVLENSFVEINLIMYNKVFTELPWKKVETFIIIRIIMW